MFQTIYDRLPASEKAQAHRRLRSWSFRRISRKPPPLTRRTALTALLLLVFLAASLVRLNPWSKLSVAPPTPFVLSGLGTPFRNATLETQRADLSKALSAVTRLKPTRYRPKCATAASTTSRYSHITASHTNFTIFLAVDFTNAQWVLPTFIHGLPTLVSVLGSHRFHVSIFENGSSDLTASLLVTLARVLAALEVSYDIVVQGRDFRSHKADNGRIVELARIRNAALEPLYTGKAAKKMAIDRFDVVLFMNDIIWCPRDILEILHEHVVQGAHMTCTTDWESDIIYDRWVARTMSGLPLYSQNTLIRYFNGLKPYSPPIPRPLPYDEHERERFMSLKPFQVFSCWNGAAVIDARAFVPASSSMPHSSGDTSSRSREQPPDETSDRGIRFRTARNDATRRTVKASECFLLSVDLWKKGLGKIMLVPRASVAYDVRQYERVRQDGGRTVPHPIEIVTPALPHSGSSRKLHYATHLPSGKNFPSRDDEEKSSKSEKIRWALTPPESVVYHDYAWWHEKERWGRWDEA